jgi:hypothetical protein
VKKIPKSRVVQKIMRPLPECFRPKVIAIEESKDLDTVRIGQIHCVETNTGRGK